MTEKLFSADIPADIEPQIIASAKALLGKGYVDDYYASCASEFTWLFMCGYRRGIADQRKRRKATARKKAA